MNATSLLADGGEVLEHLLLDRLMKLGIVATVVLIVAAAMIVVWRRS